MPSLRIYNIGGILWGIHLYYGQENKYYTFFIKKINIQNAKKNMLKK